MIRAVLVARVSTRQQAKQGTSLDSQIEAMRVYAAARKWTIADELRDVVTGNSEIRERQAGRKLYAYIDGRQCEAVLFYTVDRATRDEDLVDLLLLKRDCREAGIELHFVDTGQARHDLVGQVSDFMLGAFAADERKRIGRRSAQGRRDKAERNEWVGVGVAPYGTRREGEGPQTVLVRDEAEVQIGRQLFDMVLGRGIPPGSFTARGLKWPATLRGLATWLISEGVPAPGIARGMKTTGWSAPAVAHILKKRTAIGEFRYAGYIVRLPKLAFVDEATFEAVQARLSQNRDLASRKRRREYLLSSHIRCAAGHKMHGGPNGPNSPSHSYRCSLHFSLPEPCLHSRMNGRQLDELVWTWLRMLLGTEGVLEEALENLERQRAGATGDLRARLGELPALEAQARARLRRLVKAFGAVEEDDPTYQDLAAEIDEARETVTVLVREQAEIQTRLIGTDLTAVRGALEDAAARWKGRLEGANYEQRRSLLADLGVQVVYAREPDGRHHVVLQLRSVGQLAVSRDYWLDPLTNDGAPIGPSIEKALSGAGQPANGHPASG